MCQTNQMDKFGFKALKQTMELVQKLETKKEGKIKWKDRDERRRLLREEAQRKRLAALDAIVPDRKCTVCKQVKPKSRSWMVLPLADFVGLNRLGLMTMGVRFIAGETCICVSCVRKYFRGLLGKKRRPSNERLAKKNFPRISVQADSEWV